MKYHDTERDHHNKLQQETAPVMDVGLQIKRRQTKNANGTTRFHDENTPKRNFMIC